jgi:hypothetical protein
VVVECLVQHFDVLLFFKCLVDMVHSQIESLLVTMAKDKQQETCGIVESGQRQYCQVFRAYFIALKDWNVKVLLTKIRSLKKSFLRI